MELLHALTELLSRRKGQKDNITSRVERVVQVAMLPKELLSCISGTEKELSVKSYTGWLGQFGTFREAIATAFREGVLVNDLMREVLEKARQDLVSSKDPAVRYFAETLTVLPKQPRDVIPCVEWLGPEKYQKGQVSTPGGDCLGFIYRRLDGLYNVLPIRKPSGTICHRGDPD